MLTCVSGIPLFLLAPTASAQIVYQNNFEANTTGFDNSSPTSLPINGAGFGSPNQSQFLGRFANNSVTLALSSLTVGATYRVDFDLFIGASWDGNRTNFVPDNWSLTANGCYARFHNVR